MEALSVLDSNGCQLILHYPWKKDSGLTSFKGRAENGVMMYKTQSERKFKISNLSLRRLSFANMVPKQNANSRSTRDILLIEVVFSHKSLHHPTLLS